jgi:hypothetical protein
MNRKLRAKAENIVFSEARQDYPFVAAITRRIMATKAPAVRRLERRLVRLRAGSIRVKDAKGNDSTSAHIEHISSISIDAANHHAAAIADGACMQLVFAFLERTLRDLCEEVSSKPKQLSAYLRKRAKERVGKVQKYLDFLRSHGGLTFTVGPDVRRLLKREKELRDIFTHGDWLLHYFGSARDGAADALKAVASLIEALDSAYLIARPEI